MRQITGLLGRETLIEEVTRELRKGRHVLLTGPVGVGKSAVLEAAIGQLEPRASERWRIGQSAPGIFAVAAEQPRPHPDPEKPLSGQQYTILYLTDHQAKGQFVSMTRQLLETGLAKPSAFDLPEELDEVSLEALKWDKLKRTINRQSVRDLTSVIIHVLHRHRQEGRKVIIAVDDMTCLTPTQQAFWLMIFDQAQVIGCAVTKGKGWSKLWWKMREIAVEPLPSETATAVVREFIAQQGMLIESPDLYVSQVVKQSGGNPQAVYDMLDHSSKERLVDKRQIRELRHQAGIEYVDFTPVMLLLGAGMICLRYLAKGLDDTALYLLAGMGAAVFLGMRLMLARGMGKTS